MIRAIALSDTLSLRAAGAHEVVSLFAPQLHERDRGRGGLHTVCARSRPMHRGWRRAETAARDSPSGRHVPLTRGPPTGTGTTYTTSRILQPFEDLALPQRT